MTTKNKVGAPFLIFQMRFDKDKNDLLYHKHQPLHFSILTMSEVKVLQVLPRHLF